MFDCIFAYYHFPITKQAALIVALCFIAIGCGSTSTTTTSSLAAPEGKLLPLQYKKQLASQLCWAAVADMVMTYWRQHDSDAYVMSQCEQARYNYYVDNNETPVDTPACVGDSILPQFNQPNNPFIGIIPLINNYNYSSYSGIIPWDTLKSQIDSGMAVIAQWNFRGVLPSTKGKKSSHFILVDGYIISSITGQRFISYCDPWATDYAKHKLMPYDIFADPHERAFLNYTGYRFDGTNGYMYHLRPRKKQQKQ